MATTPPQQTTALAQILYGSTAGIFSKLLEHPFDLVKVRLQSQPLHLPPQFSGPWSCFLFTLKHEGVRALWRGVSMPVGGAMAENATLFLVCNQMQDLLKHHFPPATLDNPTDRPPTLALGQLTISAALAGSAASFVLTPVELVKCKMQVQNIVASTATPIAAVLSSSTLSTRSPPAMPHSASLKSVADSRKIPLTTPLPPKSATKPPGPVAITLSILRAEGPRGLWLGQTGTFIRETGGSAAWFVTFELLTSYHLHRRHNAGQRSSTGGVITRGDLTGLELMSSGAFAGVFYNVLLFPADCIKSTIQTEDELRGLAKSGEGRRSFMQVGKDILRARGVKGLYQGCGVTALRAAPSSALIFYIYSRLEAYFA